MRSCSPQRVMCYDSDAVDSPQWHAETTCLPRGDKGIPLSNASLNVQLRDFSSVSSGTVHTQVLPKSPRSDRKSTSRTPAFLGGRRCAEQTWLFDSGSGQHVHQFSDGRESRPDPPRAVRQSRRLHAALQRLGDGRSAASGRRKTCRSSAWRDPHSHQGRLRPGLEKRGYPRCWTLPPPVEGQRWTESSA